MPPPSHPPQRLTILPTPIVLPTPTPPVRQVKLSFVGCGFLLANLVCACAERMLQRHLLAVRSVDVSKPALMILNNGIGTMLALGVMAFAEPRGWHRLGHVIHRDPTIGIAVGLSCLVGCAISYTGLWFQHLVTATSFMVLGSLTKVAVIMFGIAFLRESSGPLSLFGAALSLGGGYAYARLR